MHNDAMKFSPFAKLDDFSLKYRNFSELSALPAPKMSHLTQSYPKVTIFGAFGVQPRMSKKEGLNFNTFLVKSLMSRLQLND